MRIEDSRFNSRSDTQLSVRKYLFAVLLCGIFFLYPFQVYVIGDNIGIGIEGAVYRLQITDYGNSFIPITSDLRFVAMGIYSGRTAFSILVWVLGTILLTATTVFGLIFAGSQRADFWYQISLGLAGTCIAYLISCMFQYGYLFIGKAGISIPAGIFLILFWVIFLNAWPGIIDVDTLFSGRKD